MKHQWLENLEDPKAHAWVNEQSDRTLKELKNYSSFELFYQEASEIFSSRGRIPCQSINDGFVYDVMTSKISPMGILRRCPVTKIENENSIWDHLLDFDLLSKELGDEWNYAFTQASPSGKKLLIGLSHRGKDSHWTREFDLLTKTFVKNGFEIPLSKSKVSWFDEDTIIVGGEIPETSNDLGYSKIVRLWKRGSSEKAILVEGENSEHIVWSTGRKNDDTFAFISRNITWDMAKNYIYSFNSGVQELHLPLVTEKIMRFDQELIFSIHQDHQDFPGGTILQVNFQEALLNVNPILKVVWSPPTTKISAGCFKFKDFLVVTYMENIRVRFEFFKNINGAWELFSEDLPEVLSKNLGVSNIYQDEATEKLYFQMECFTNPPTLYEWSPQNFKKIKSLKKQFEGDYTTRQDWVVSKDGTKVPYFMVSKKDLIIDHNTPTLLTGYGGFNLARTPTYMAANGKLWLEKGGVYVLANIRGGGEFGPSWHLSARKENKQKSYDDFIAVAEDLISRNVTSPSRLAIVGGSNGGLLVGAVTMQRPDLFAAVLCTLPLLDMIRYVELPPGASWMEEYGDPSDPGMKEVILKYSPYQNIKTEKNYPKIFFMTSTTDDRVHPSHARKMTAKMLDLGKDCYLYEETSGGHGGGNNHVKALDLALKFSYLWKRTSS